MTAVEWLFAQMSNVSAGFATELNELEMLQQAKEMEKEQMSEMYRKAIKKYDPMYGKSFKSE